jgi:glutaredoxin 2
MPKLNKQYTLEVTVEQFLEACSLTELQEIDLLLNRFIQYKIHTSSIKNEEQAFDQKWEASRNKFRQKMEDASWLKKMKDEYEKTLPESSENQ